jgi:16S rRNA (adenine1518-N6/adenine1519-N6)-dimethyltransferase
VKNAAIGLQKLTSLRKQLNDLQIRPRKKLGQHFVVQDWVLQKIARDADLGPEDIVLEIGAGLGHLTAFLTPAQKVFAVEIDPRLTPLLQDRFKENPNVEIIHADALEIKISSFFRPGGRKLKVVANLPYEISSPLIFRLWKEREAFSRFVLMLQLEVARRIVAQPGSKEYGPLSIWSQLHSVPRISFWVPPSAFYPQPKVESAVVRFDLRQRPAVEVPDEQYLERLVRSAFGYRRKTLPRALQLGEFSRFSKNQIRKALETAGVSPLARAESLTLEQFGNLSRAIRAVADATDL